MQQHTGHHAREQTVVDRFWEWYSLLKTTALHSEVTFGKLLQDGGAAAHGASFDIDEIMGHELHRGKVVHLFLHYFFLYSSLSVRLSSLELSDAKGYAP